VAKYSIQFEMKTLLAQRYSKSRWYDMIWWYMMCDCHAVGYNEDSCGRDNDNNGDDNKQSICQSI